MAQRTSALGGRPFTAASVNAYYDLAILGMLGSGYGAVLASGAMDAPSAALAGTALTARLAAVLGWIRFRIPALWVNVITLGYIAFYPLDWQFVSKDFLAATIHLVFFVAVIKLLTAESQRDFLLLKVIALLEILAASLLSTDLAFLAFLGSFLVSSVAALAAGEIKTSAQKSRVVPAGSRSFGRRLSAMTAVAAAAIVVVTGALFFLLPRTARAALGWMTPSQSRVSGFGNEVVLGQSGAIRRSNEAVLHFHFKDGIQPAGLRWRATALGEFDGWKWFNTPSPPKALLPGDDGLLKLAGDDQLRREGRRLNYEVMLHRVNTDWLFIVGIPEYIRLRPMRLLATSAGGLRVPFAQADGLRYNVIAWPGEAMAPVLPPEERIHHLRLPQPDPRVLKLANDVTAGARNDLERAHAIEEWLRTRLKYSLDPWERVVDDPLAHFLFERKKGHCEYFASAMAVMLRAVWIPSRVATGFLGGTRNPLIDWQVVRASDAHSWVEAWIPGRGWVTFDPTPSAEPGGEGWSRLSMWLDAAELFWQEWVVGYDLDRQLTLALRVSESRKGLNFDWAARWWSAVAGAAGKTPPGGGWLPWAAGLALLLAAAAGAPLALRQAGRLALRRRAARGEASRHDASVFYSEMLNAVARRGFVKLTGQTPEEFARSIPDSKVGEAVGEFTRAYYGARFGGSPAGAAQLGPLLDRIKSLP